MKGIKETQKEFFEKDEIADFYKGDYKNTDKNYRILSSLGKKKSILSLGCGGGREVKELLRFKHKITAVDFSQKMIYFSKKIAPKAEYYCDDVVNFARKNKNNLKFDYILGLFSLFNYIPRGERRELIENLYSMLKPKGKIILTFAFYNSRAKDVIKSVLSPIYLFKHGILKSYEFGDIYNTKTSSISHHYTKNQLKKIFKGYSYRISKEGITLTK